MAKVNMMRLQELEDLLHRYQGLDTLKQTYLKKTSTIVVGATLAGNDKSYAEAEVSVESAISAVELEIDKTRNILRKKFKIDA